jgi:tetratricopeptide (TPR) repeat protein
LLAGRWGRLHGARPLANTATRLDVSTALQTAVQHHGAGRLDEAERLYDAVLGALPDHADTLHMRGILAFQRDAFDRAAELIGRAIAVAGGEADYHNSLANVRIRQGAWDEAEASLRRALALRPDYPEATVNLGLALYGAGRTEAAADMLRRGIALLPGHAQARAALGLIAFEAGDGAEAAVQLRTAAAQSPRYGYGAVCLFGDDLAAWTDTKRIDALFNTAPAIEGEMPVGGKYAMVAMSACDQVYFERFARTLALSLDRNAPGNDLHLHVFNPGPDFDRQLLDLKRCLDQTGLTVSRETMPGADPVYFSNMRFARLYQVMEACGRDMFMLDTDSLVRGKLDGLRDAVGGADVAITARFDRAELGQKMLATTIFFRNSPACRDMLGRIAAYMLNGRCYGRLAWYLDQSVLYLVWRTMERAGTPVALAELPAGYADSAFSPDSVVWAAKGERKTDDAFVVEARRIARAGASGT